MHRLGEDLIPIRASVDLGPSSEMSGLAQELEYAGADVDGIAAGAGGEASVGWTSEAAEAYRVRLAESVGAIRSAADCLREAASMVAGYARQLGMCPAPGAGGGL